MNPATLAFHIDRKLRGHGELVSAAYIGIIEAAERYRDDRGASKFTHAYRLGYYAALEAARPPRRKLAMPESRKVQVVVPKIRRIAV